MGKKIGISDTEGHRLFKRLVSFLGEEEILRRLAAIDRQKKLEKGIYLDYWVKPTTIWWEGLRDALNELATSGSLKRKLTDIMLNPFLTAAYINSLFSSMSPEVRKEFASRILNSEQLTPVFVELTVAAQFKQEGYEIVWSKSGVPNADAAPEFIAKKGKIELEVECKSKGVDAGRRVLRQRFYRLADLILDLLDKRKLHGRIEITVDDNLPANVEWQKKLLSSLPENPGSKTIDLEDGTRVSASLQAQTGKQMDFDKLVLESQERKTPHQHMAFAGSTEGDKAVNVTVFKIKSVSKDTYIKSTLKDLRKASSQFSGTRPGAIFCFLPEINSFEGVHENSPINKMTQQFFDRSAKKSICSVVYFSNEKLLEEPYGYSGDSPALTMFNPHYDESLGNCAQPVREITSLIGNA